LNPRYAINAHTISSRAPSAARTSLREREIYMKRLSLVKKIFPGGQLSAAGVIRFFYLPSQPKRISLKNNSVAPAKTAGPPGNSSTPMQKEGTDMKKTTCFMITAAFLAITSTPVMSAEPPAADKPKIDIPTLNTKPAPAPAGETKPATNAQPVKIGFVDMTKVAGESVQGKAAFTEIKAKTAKLKSQIESREKQLAKQKAAIEAALPSLSPNERTAKAKEFQKKLEDYQKFVQKADKDIRAREEALLTALYRETAKASSEYGTAQGLSAVLIKKDILFLGATTEAKDVTGEIITIIDGKKDAK
jgi:outer membrane protein